MYVLNCLVGTIPKCFQLDDTMVMEAVCNEYITATVVSKLIYNFYLTETKGKYVPINLYKK